MPSGDECDAAEMIMRFSALLFSKGTAFKCPLNSYPIDSLLKHAHHLANPWLVHNSVMRIPGPVWMVRNLLQAKHSVKCGSL